MAAPKPLKPVYLLVGTDRPRIGMLWRRMIERIGRDAGVAPVVTRLSARDAAAADAVGAVDMLSLDGAPRLVRVDDADRWRAADADALVAYLRTPAPDAVLFLVCDQVKDSTRWIKAVLAAGDRIACEAPKPWQLPAWVATAFRDAGVDADREACVRLVAVVGPDLDRLASEVAKLAVWAAGERVDEHAVAEVCGADAAPLEWALADAVLARDAGAAGRALAALEAGGASPGAAVWKVGGPVRDLRLLVSDPDRIRPPWRVDKLRRQGAAWRGADLDAAARLVAALELDSRGRAKGDEAQAAALARTVARLTRV